MHPQKQPKLSSAGNRKKRRHVISTEKHCSQKETVNAARKLHSYGFKRNQMGTYLLRSPLLKKHRFGTIVFTRAYEI